MLLPLCLLLAQAISGESAGALPAGAVVIQKKLLPQSAHAGRMLVLWMEHPEKHERSVELGEETPYTCPDDTRGSYYTGPTRVSLVDSRSGAIVNTVRIMEFWAADYEKDSFDVPYRIRPGSYMVQQPLRKGEGNPDIVNLKDYNGDGAALEFALFDAQNCTVTQTSLVGYSIRQDRVVWYPIRIQEWTGADKPPRHWLDDLFTQKPVSPGRWSYKKFYNGDPGFETIYDVRYDAAHEEFVGHATRRRVPDR
jgi:hypothetical protein